MLRETVPLAHAISNQGLVRDALSASHLRVDGRAPETGRALNLALRRHEGSASAELRLGRTRCLAEVSGELVQPFPDRPSEGMLQFNVEFSPMASEGFDVYGRPPAAAVEISRIIERAVRDSQALDAEALCVIHGERVWCIRVDVTVLDHDGNLIDAALLGSMAALQHFRRPEVSVEQEGGEEDEGGVTRIVVHHSDEKPTTPLPLHHVPLSVTFAILLLSSPEKEEGKAAQGAGGSGGGGGEERTTAMESITGASTALALVDPTVREEAVMAGRVTFSANAYRELTAIHKLGGAPIGAPLLVRLAKQASDRAGELHKWLSQELKAAEAVAQQERAARLRGKDFEGSSWHGGSSGAVEEAEAAGALKHLGYDDLNLTFVTKDDTVEEDGEEEGGEGAESTGTAAATQERDTSGGGKKAAKKGGKSLSAVVEQTEAVPVATTTASAVPVVAAELDKASRKGVSDVASPKKKKRARKATPAAAPPNPPTAAEAAGSSDEEEEESSTVLASEFSQSRKKR